MAQESRQGATIQEVQSLAHNLGGIGSIEQYLRSVWYFIDDPPDTEYVRQPELQTEIFKSYGVFVGDCDDAATMAGALVLAAGGAGALIAIRNPYKMEFSHVWLRATAGGFSIDIDPVTPAWMLPLRNFAESMVVYV